jgi:hypothetical protein
MAFWFHQLHTKDSSLEAEEGVQPPAFFVPRCFVGTSREWCQVFIMMMMRAAAAAAAATNFGHTIIIAATVSFQ